ncbi:polyprenyl diphosphate synthase [Pseudoteredinibacter isoporae]|uniref:polyprenyl diphosphate synthase n=1 Tax=Pseudoteredinibacter isoporae TaxID=570281 RepID=UPI003105D1FB
MSEQTAPKTSPRHIGIIMDGNNRWAKQRGLGGGSGHKAGVEKIRAVLKACREHKVEVLTLFAFSSENWRRPPKEVEALMSLFYSYLRREARKLRDENVALRVIGRRDRFSPKLQDAIAEAESIACEGEATLVIAADYGGRWDIAQASQKLAEQVRAGDLSPEEVDEDSLHKHTCLADLPELDLLIRTGGEVRISNFLLWQCSYSELYFCDCLWPDFGPEQIEAAVSDFYQRQRRFGKTSEQILAEQA